MLVKHRMHTQLAIIPPETSVTAALNLLHERKIRRLPVVDAEGELVGIISEKDLLHASPSPASSLNIHEQGYLLSRITVADIMTKNVRTIDLNAPLEEAAHIMAEKKIGSLLVLDESDELVGILTETDVFTTVAEMLGAQEAGVRVTLHVPDRPGMLNTITAKVAELGGDITALGTLADQTPGLFFIVIKLRGVAVETLTAALDTPDITILDLREV